MSTYYQIFAIGITGNTYQYALNAWACRWNQGYCFRTLERAQGHLTTLEHLDLGLPALPKNDAVIDTFIAAINDKGEILSSHPLQSELV